MWYFAYGANMNSRHMDQLCPGALLLDRGRLDGFRFLINAEGYAALTQAPDASVHGVIWQVTPEHEQILDHYEEVREGLYRKEHLEVNRSEGGLKLSALVYVANDTLPGVPEKDYMELVLSGAWSACKAGLPREYLMELESWKPVVGE